MMNNLLLQKKNLSQTDIKMLIVQAVQEVLNDPDFGLELSMQSKKRLREIQKGKSKKIIPFTEIKRKYL